MHTTNQLLDLIAVKHGGCSDYRLAKLLNTSTSAVSAWRKHRAGMSQDFAVRAAALLGWDAAYTVACVERQRAERDVSSDSGIIRMTWERIAERFSPTLPALFLALIFTAKGDNARAGTSGSLAPSPIFSDFCWSLYTLCVLRGAPLVARAATPKRDGVRGLAAMRLSIRTERAALDRTRCIQSAAVTDSVTWGLSAEAMAELAGVHITTARTWKRTGTVPTPAERLIRLLTTGDLGLMRPEWRGWTLGRGDLTSPGGITVVPGEVQAIPFVRAQVAAYQARSRFALQADWVDQRYVGPDETLLPDTASEAG